MKRTKEEAAVTRRTLLKQALDTFSKQGYSASTLEDIARDANLTRGAIYWHFGSKAELYNTLVEEYAGRATVVMQQAIAEGGSLLEILRRVFVRQLQAIEQDDELRAVMELALFKTGGVPELEEGRKQQIESGLSLVDMLAGVMKQGAEQGLLRGDMAPKTMARAYLAYQNGLIHLWLSAPGEFSLEQSAQAFAEVLLAGFISRE